MINKKIYFLLLLGLIFVSMFFVADVINSHPNEPSGAISSSDRIKINYNGEIKIIDLYFPVYAGDNVTLLEGNAKINLCNEPDVNQMKQNKKIKIKSCEYHKKVNSTNFLAFLYTEKRAAIATYNSERSIKGVSIYLPNYGDKILSSSPNLFWIDTNSPHAKNYEVVMNEIEKSTDNIIQTLWKKKYNYSGRLTKYPYVNDKNKLLKSGKSYQICINGVCNNFDILKRKDLTKETLDIIENKIKLTNDESINAILRANYLENNNLNYEAANILLEEYSKCKTSDCRKIIKRRLNVAGILTGN